MLNVLIGSISVWCIMGWEIRKKFMEKHFCNATSNSELFFLWKIHMIAVGINSGEVFILKTIVL